MLLNTGDDVLRSELEGVVVKDNSVLGGDDKGSSRLLLADRLKGQTSRLLLNSVAPRGGLQRCRTREGLDTNLVGRMCQGKTSSAEVTGPDVWSRYPGCSLGNLMSSSEETLGYDLYLCLKVALSTCLCA